MGEKVKKMRLDQLLVEKGFVGSREKAKRLIMAGEVLVNGEVIYKPAVKVEIDADINLKTKEKYVSRGGYKIESAWKVFKFDVAGKVVCDIGASTGGFTDFLLQMGAKKVYAVDVGRGQLHWKLRNDPRVVLLEKINARYLTEEDLGEKVDFVTCDVSFISILKIVPAIKRVLKEGGEFLLLIKPQFEAGKNFVKNGIVDDPEVHFSVLKKVIGELNEKGLNVKGATFSGLKGAKGNIEYFVYGFNKDSSVVKLSDIEEVVKTAHEVLGGVT